MLCIRCNTRPACIKKYQLCSACYQKQHRQQKKEELPSRFDIDFIKTFNHNSWTYKSIIFKISATENFIPTFYDARNNILIEVIDGSTIYQKNKYALFRKVFPKINLEIKTPDGEIVTYTKWKRSHEKWNQQKNKLDRRKKARARWSAMLQRCNNSNNPSYKDYGGRGISVCEHWHNFENFYADTGDKPDEMSFDRTNNDGNYEPNNWRWATHKEQAANSRGSWKNNNLK